MLFREHRCPSCNKLLFKGLLVDSEVEIKCRGCGALATFHGEPKEKLLCFKGECPHRVGRSEAVKEGKRPLASR